MLDVCEFIFTLLFVLEFFMRLDTFGRKYYYNFPSGSISIEIREDREVTSFTYNQDTQESHGRLS